MAGSTTSRVAALDGLRGLAALAVVSSHVVVHLGLLPFAPLGSMGVIVFFALSGYLVAGLVWRAPASWAAHRTFLRRRVVRLLPPVVLVVGAGGTALVLLGGLPWRDAVRGGALVLVQGTGLASGLGIAPVVPFHPTWSLTVEWVFYLLVPAALVALRARGRDERSVTRLLAGSAAVLYLVALPLPAAAFYHLPVGTLAVLVAGAALATWHRVAPTTPVDPVRSAMALVMLGLFVVLPGSGGGAGWRLAVVPATTLATLVLLHAVRAGDPVAGRLAAAPLRAVGQRAYSLYVWHVPVLWLVWTLTPDLGPWARAAVALPVVALVTVVAFELVECPVLHPGVDRRRAPVPAVSAAPTP